jgi:stress-induced-phosphoprotein 1
MSAASFKEKGNQFLQAKQYDEAIQAYTEAINLDPTDHVFFSNRSAAYLSKGDAANALSDGERCVQLKSDWAKGYTRKGAALHALRRYEDAVKAYQDGLAIAPTDSGLVSGLKEVEKAMESAQASPAGGGLFGPQMIAKLAGHPKFGPKLGDPAFVRKLQSAQSNPQLLMSDPEMMEVLQVILGGMGGGEEDDVPAPSSSSQKTPPKRAEPEVELSEEQKQQKSARDRSVAAKERGNTFYKNKQFAEALTAYDEAIQADPTNLMVMNNKAAVYIEMGECDTAIETCNLIFEKARSAGVIVSYEDKAKVYQRVAAAHLKKDDIPAAVKAYGQAQMESFDKAVERKMKNLELDLKKKQKQDYINPELGLAAKERGNQLFRDADYPGAIKEYEEAVKRDPTNAPYHNNLAAAYLKMALFNDAKREVERSLELDKTYVKAWAKKGDIEFFMKEYHKSLDSYRAGLQLEPDNSLCKQGMQKTLQKINEGGADKERAAHAMADPEIQAILQDPTIRQVLNDFQDNPKFAQAAMQNDKDIRSKIEKLIAAGVLQVK